MTPQQIQLVQNSFSLVQPIADTAATIFYDRLFVLDPSLRPMFKGDMKEQRKKLMAAITLVVTGLNNLGSIINAVEHLGRTHVRYGVKDSHYDTVGAALIWTLGQGLGDAFTPDIKTSWIAAYNILATTMKAAANEVVLQPAPAARPKSVNQPLAV
jgi:hemoglobin-like flavoprotein